MTIESLREARRICLRRAALHCAYGERDNAQAMVLAAWVFHDRVMAAMRNEGRFANRRHRR